MRQDDTIELSEPPVFGFGDKVRALKDVRNDGTFLGKNIGDKLVMKDDIGYVRSVGTFLQQYFIFGIDFIERGLIVGMRAKELELIEDASGLENKR